MNEMNEMKEWAEWVRCLRFAVRRRRRVGGRAGEPSGMPGRFFANASPSANGGTLAGDVRSRATLRIARFPERVQVILSEPNGAKPRSCPSLRPIPIGR
jgi:hypothetical protein